MRRGHAEDVGDLEVAGPETEPDPGRSDLRRILVGLDAIAVAVPLASVLFAVGDVGRAPGAAALEVAIVTVAALWLIASHRLYRARVCAVRAYEISRLLRVSALVGLAAVAAGGVAPLVIGAGDAALATGFSALSLVVLRGLYRSWLGGRRQQGLSVRPVILVGVNEETRELIELMSDHPELGYTACGVVGSRSNAIQLGLDHLWRGHVSSASRVVQELDATGAIVAANALSSSELNAVIRDLLAIGTHVHLSYGLRGIHHRRLLATPLAHEPLYYIEPSSLSRWQLAAKRALDVAIGSFALLISTPVLLLAAAAIKLHDRGPVLFSQERVGQNGRPFRIFKLRTMVVDAEKLLVDLREKNERAGPLFKLTRDPRVTGIGRILRLTSIDELPQLFNVLRGEMSLVGPRPALPSEVATFDDELLARSRVLPGITGLWQVEARDNPSFDSYRRLDLFYVENWSVTLDLVILLGTVEAELLRVFRALAGRKREGSEPALATVGAPD